MKKSLKVLGICIIILLFSSFTLAAKTIPAFDPVLENAEGETTAFLVLNDEKKAVELHGVGIIKQFNKFGVIEVKANAQTLRNLVSQGKVKFASAPRRSVLCMSVTRSDWPVACT